MGIKENVEEAIHTIEDEMKDYTEMVDEALHLDPSDDKDLVEENNVTADLGHPEKGLDAFIEKKEK